LTLRNKFFKGMCNWMVSMNISRFKLQMPDFFFFFWKALQATYSRPVNTSKTLSVYLLRRNLGRHKRWHRRCLHMGCCGQNSRFHGSLYCEPFGWQVRHWSSF
jgi:hypothetical protein